MPLPPIRRSQRQKARAAAALGRPLQTDVVTPAAEPDPVQPAVRLSTAAAPLTARQRWEADVESRLESIELLQREMRENRTLLQYVLSNVAVASTVPVPSSIRGAAVASTSRRGGGASAASATVASTSRQGAAPSGSAPVATIVAPHGRRWRA